MRDCRGMLIQCFSFAETLFKISTPEEDNLLSFTGALMKKSVVATEKHD